MVGRSFVICPTYSTYPTYPTYPPSAVIQGYNMTRNAEITGCHGSTWKAAKFWHKFPARTFNYPQKVWPKGSNMNLIAKAEREWCTVTARGVLRDCTTGIT